MSEQESMQSGNSGSPRGVLIRPFVIILTMMAIGAGLMLALFNIPQDYYFAILLLGTVPVSHWITKQLTGVDFEKEYLSKWIENIVH